MISFSPVSGLRALFGRSGGLGYHFAALIFSRELWAPFRERLTEELNERVQRMAGLDLSGWHLYWVGPSGGYCIKSEWLDRFGAVTALDLDPLAGLILRNKTKAPFRFRRVDFFQSLEAQQWSLEAWVRKGSPKDSNLRPLFLFSNLLGQLEFVYDERGWNQVTRGLEKAFSQTSIPWLSFHDRLSVNDTASRTSQAIFDRETRDQPLASEALAEAFYEDFPAKPPMEVEEHRMGSWIRFARPPYRYLSWRITADTAQLIEITGNF